MSTERDRDPVAEPVEPDWEEQASYIVSFDRSSGLAGDSAAGGEPRWQTRIWDNQSLVETVLEGADPTRWAAVITDRLRRSSE